MNKISKAICEKCEHLIQFLIFYKHNHFLQQKYSVSHNNMLNTIERYLH